MRNDKAILWPEFLTVQKYKISISKMVLFEAETDMLAGLQRWSLQRQAVVPDLFSENVDQATPDSVTRTFNFALRLDDLRSAPPETVAPLKQIRLN